MDDDVFRHLPDFVQMNHLAGSCAGCGKVKGTTTTGYRCWWERRPIIEALICQDCYTSETLRRIYHERVRGEG